MLNQDSEQRIGTGSGDGGTGAPVTELGYKPNGRTRKGRYGDMLVNWGGTAINNLAPKTNVLGVGFFCFIPIAGRNSG
ncbi:hypothetical protein ATG71_0292 [Bacillus sp. es.034]|nr:hypothetical protein ATG71_0292 [Bacillus sp. es.034]